MYVKIHSPKNSGGNRGSSSALINYLEKENSGVDFDEHEHFFTHTEDVASGEKAMNQIDNNWRGLKSNDAKFFMVTINPSERELVAIGNDHAKLREYTRNVMDEYAKGFNRQIDGRPIDGNDLIYFAKIENHRRYDPYDKQFKEQYNKNYEIRFQINEIVKQEQLQPVAESRIKELEKQYSRDSNGTVILPGNAKPGLNTHVHIVVARKDKAQRVSLSPFANSKGAEIELNGKKVQVGFNRKQFQHKCERQFDKQFEYKRSVEEKFEFKLSKSKGEPNYVRELISLPRNEQEMAKRIVFELIDKDKQLRRILNPITKLPTSVEQLHSKAINKAIEKVAEMLIGGANPPAAAIKAVVSRTLSMAINAALGL
jgi:uncharacterized protein YdhG (YjbR/CyaY superfamily)